LAEQSAALALLAEFGTQLLVDGLYFPASVVCPKIRMADFIGLALDGKMDGVDALHNCFTALFSRHTVARSFRSETLADTNN